jgi:hypothetical protein
MAASLIAASIATTARRKLKEAGAFSRNTAKKPEELNVPEKWLQIPRVKKTEDGRYYLCQDKQ